MTKLYVMYSVAFGNLKHLLFVAVPTIAEYGDVISRPGGLIFTTSERRIASIRTKIN